MTSETRKPFDYLPYEAAPDAPFSDNPSGYYCPGCRASGLAHCSEVDYCGGMKKMRVPPASPEGTV
jgi:hypothetical protein